MTPRFGAGGPWAELVALPKDPAGYVRRECPACHRVFKVRGTGLEGAVVYRRVSGKVAHQNADEARWPLATRSCPYCGSKAPDDDWFTAEQRAWIDKRAATLDQELRYEQLAFVARTLGSNPNPTFLPVRPELPAEVLKSEPDDMVPVPLPCCLEEVKVSENWLGPVRCFYCGLEHQLGSELFRERLERLLSES